MEKSPISLVYVAKSLITIRTTIRDHSQSGENPNGITSFSSFPLPFFFFHDGLIPVLKSVQNIQETAH